jgi:tetratricopeptide (TPR) repeat protein
MTRHHASRARGAKQLVLIILAGVSIPGSAPAQDRALEQGISLFEARRYSEARTRLASLASGAGGNAMAAQYLGRIALHARDLDGAVRHFEYAVRLEPSVARHHLWLGRAYGQQALRAGKLKGFSLAKRSRVELESAVRLDSDDAEARAELAHFYAIAPKIVGGDKGKARAEAEAIATRDPYRGLLVHGFVHERDKRYSDAAKEYRAAMRLFPDSAAPHYLLGLMFQNREMLDSARAVFDSALVRFPGERATYYYVARVNVLAKHDLGRAEQLLQRYLRLPLKENDPPYASAHFRLGQICELTGRPRLARRHFETALRLDPTRGEYRQALAAHP